MEGSPIDRASDQNDQSGDLFSMSEDTESTVAGIIDALLCEDETICWQLIRQQQVQGRAVSWICDQILAPAFHQIGDRWERREVDIYQERSACCLAVRLLHRLRARARSVDSSLLALGGSLEGDPYLVPITMCDTVLTSVGWNSRLLGNSIPTDSIVKAIEKHRPLIFWVSVSCVDHEAGFISGFNQIAEAASQIGTVFIAGGRALTQPLRTRLRYAAFCDTMEQFDSLATTLRKQLLNRSSLLSESSSAATTVFG
jgi:MerR family transcriptional regulator, light-induced transcriptional regulator